MHSPSLPPDPDPAVEVPQQPGPETRWSDIAELQQENDPLLQGARATDLINECSERVDELARIRRTAIERAHREHGLSYAEIAEALGLSRGRLTQIRTSPSAH